ncbi:MAG: hypothetical protein FWG77_01245 [Treponema sp.]|nr:hypothetical protein [Treponema sp.]
MRWLFLFLALLSVPVLQAQQIPLALILEGLTHAERELWRPDWPLSIPPDSFKYGTDEETGAIARAAIAGEDLFLELRVGRGGRVERFPFMLEGRMAQVSVAYGLSLDIQEIIINFIHGGDPWRLEVLERSDSYPLIIRASGGGVWYFIYLTHTASEITETWYDVDGNFVGAFNYSLTQIDTVSKIRAYRDFHNPTDATEFFFDSRGFVTEITGPVGSFRALYFREDLPRYWERRPVDSSNMDENGFGNFVLQWDANDKLVRITGWEENENASLDYRFEYDLDDTGNWNERREIRMVRINNLLVPSPGNRIRRFLEFGE